MVPGYFPSAGLLGLATGQSSLSGLSDIEQFQRDAMMFRSQPPPVFNPTFPSSILQERYEWLSRDVSKPKTIREELQEEVDEWIK